MNLQEAITKSLALEEQMQKVNQRIDSLTICDAPPTKTQTIDPKLQVQHLLNPAPPSDEPIDWLTKGIQAVDDAKYLQQSTKKATASLWKRALSDSDEGRHDPDVNQLWKRLQTFLQSIPKDSTRNTYFGQIETVFKAMGMEYDHDFKIAHSKLSNKVKADGIVGHLPKKIVGKAFVTGVNRLRLPSSMLNTYFRYIPKMFIGRK